MVPVAELASYKNIPVFSWLANDENFDNKDKATTLIRVIHPLSQLGKKKGKYCIFEYDELKYFWNF